MRYIAALMILAGCGSGGVTDPSTKPELGALRVTPAAATLYSGVPATFIAQGGTPPYIAVSSNQTLLPIAGTVGTAFDITARAVGVDTSVTLTVVDNVGARVEVPVTVKPNVVSSAVTITPTDASCKPGICSGSDALVSVTVASVDGAPRAVRFDRVSGDFQVVGDSVVQTDATGKAQTRIRMNPAAPTQLAFLNVTDVATGSFQQVGFQIIQKTTAAFSTIPQTLTFTGADTSSCGYGSSDVYIFGGAPPYTIGTLSGFSISPQMVNASGGSFQVTALGVCTSGPLPITDSSGGTGSISLASVRGATAAAVSVDPGAITLSDCNIRTANVTGGNGSYTVTVSDSSAVVAGVSRNTLSVQRAAGGAPGTYTVSVASGNSRATIIVTVPSSPSVTC